jgi:hypothetical protein
MDASKSQVGAPQCFPAATSAKLHVSALHDSLCAHHYLLFTLYNEHCQRDAGIATSDVVKKLTAQPQLTNGARLNTHGSGRPGSRRSRRSTASHHRRQEVALEAVQPEGRAHKPEGASGAAAAAAACAWAQECKWPPAQCRGHAVPVRAPFPAFQAEGLGPSIGDSPCQSSGWSRPPGAPPGCDACRASRPPGRLTGRWPRTPPGRWTHTTPPGSSWGRRGCGREQRHGG